MTEFPHSYLMHIRTSVCSTCGAVEQWSETLRVSFDERAGTRHLQPINGAALDTSLPVGISRLPTHTIPLCQSCVLTHQPTAPDYQSEQRWRETLQRKAAQTKPTPSPEIALLEAILAKDRTERKKQAAPQPKRIIAELDQL